MSFISGTIGAIMGANATEKAAATQAQAQRDAAATQAQTAAESMAIQRDMQNQLVNMYTTQYNQNQANIQPWLAAGTTALGKQAAYPDFTSKYSTFSSPYETFKFDTADVYKDPGYKFRLQQGLDAINAKASQGGNLMSGNLGVALTNYGQDYASNEYGNAYNRALGENILGYNRDVMENQMGYGKDLTNYLNQYNMLAGLSGTGQVAANNLANLSGNYTGQMGNTSTSTANALSNILAGLGLSQAQGITGSAAAQALGTLGSAGAYTNLLNNTGQNAISGLGAWNKYNMYNDWMGTQAYNSALGEGGWMANNANMLSAQGGAPITAADLAWF